MTRTAIAVFLVFVTIGCAPSARLTFPTHPLYRTDGRTWYDTDHDGKPNFAISDDGNTLYYDDQGDGRADRVYHLSDYADRDVPHAIILLDSVPFQSLADWYAAGHMRWFSPPVKVIPPFPSLTEICYSDVLHAPPLPGMIDQSYDPRLREQRPMLWLRVEGYSEPWERRLDYHAAFWESAFAFLSPRSWYAGELERARSALERSPYRVTMLYLLSASPMACKYGKAGIDETLAGAEQLCLQLLYERHGAIKISLMADHGHNLTPSKNVPIDRILRAAGFHPRDTIDGNDDVVVEVNGLVTYAAVQTSQPIRVAEVLLARSEVQLVMYMAGDRVIVRDAHRKAAIECKDRKVRYVAIDGDLLGYEPVIAELQSRGKADADGYVSDEDWLQATTDHQWPDAPRRIWDAFHRIAESAPRVMFTLNDGYCSGLDSFTKYIDMASTHGGLNQINSATFVMTMMNAQRPASLRSRDVLNWIEPGFEPLVREK